MWLKKEGLFRLIRVLIHSSPTRSCAITTVVACLCVGYHLLLFRIHWASSLQSREEGYIIPPRPYVFIRGRKPSLDIQKSAMLLCQHTTSDFQALCNTLIFSPSFSGLLQSIPFNFVREKGFII